MTRDSRVRWLRHKFHINNIAASRVPAAGAIKSTECLHEARKKGLNIGASYFRKKGSATFATRWRGVVSMRTRQNNSTLGGPGLACMAMVRTSQRSIIILMISVFLIEPLRLPARACPPAQAPRAVPCRHLPDMPPRRRFVANPQITIFCHDGSAATRRSESV